MDTKVILITLALLTVVPLHASGSGGRTVVDAYYVTSVPGSDCPLLQGDSIFAAGPDQVEQTCFEILPGETVVSLDFEDLTGTDPYVWYMFNRDDGYIVEMASTCGDSTLAIPAGATWLGVSVEPFPNFAPDCTGIGTTGYVAATFS